MLYTGTVKKATQVFAVPGESDFIPHTTLAEDDRVGVLLKSGDDDWLFVYPLDGVGPGGWVKAARVVRDPILIVDLYSKNLKGHPDWNALAAAPGYFGAILKATEWIAFKDKSWFIANWKLVKKAGGDRYGKSWFRGAYHFLRFDADGARQADFYCDVVETAGGFDDGDLLPIVDVERGQKGSSNFDNDAKSITACTRAFVKRVRQRTGRGCILYGRGAMRDLGIKDRFGCDWLWNPSYTATMPKKTIEVVGWTLPEVALWQYTNGEVQLTKAGGRLLPAEVPGFGAVDCSVFLQGTLQDLRTNLVDGRK